MEVYYLVLGISKSANLAKIKKACRAVVKKYHPDLAGNQGAGQRFLEIRASYETLSDKTKRKQYDAELENKGSSLRIREVPVIVKERISRVNRIESLFSSPADDFLEGFLPGFFTWTKAESMERISISRRYFLQGKLPVEAFIPLPSRQWSPARDAVNRVCWIIFSVRHVMDMEGFIRKESSRSAYPRM